MTPSKCSPRRRGITLLELLIVLTLMGVAAAVVSPMLSLPSAQTGSATDAVVTEARVMAIRRAEPLRLVIDGHGVWTMRAVRGGVVVDSGVLSAPTMTLAVVVDALGRCMPDAHAVSTAAFDPLLCAFIPAANSP